MLNSSTPLNANRKEVITMVAQNKSFLLSTAIAHFRADLEAFVSESLDKKFPDVEAMNKFRQENLARRMALKDQAEGLGLNFRFEEMRARPRVVQKREEKQRQLTGTEAV